MDFTQQKLYCSLTGGTDVARFVLFSGNSKFFDEIIWEISTNPITLFVILRRLNRDFGKLSSYLE